MPSTPSVAFLQGWLTSAGLIVTIGAQNALVLRQGLARDHVGAVVALCTASDWLLIALGVFGVAGLVQRSPLAMELLRFGGAAFVIVYGARSAARAWRPGVDALRVAPGGTGLAAALGATLVMTYLNPHVYLDTIVLLGSLGSQQSGDARIAFALGAGLASAMWFATLGYGAAAASRWLRSPAVWRAIDASVALVMFLMAAQLLLHPL